MQIWYIRPETDEAHTSLYITKNYLKCFHQISIYKYFYYFVKNTYTVCVCFPLFVLYGYLREYVYASL